MASGGRVVIAGEESGAARGWHAVSPVLVADSRAGAPYRPGDVLLIVAGDGGRDTAGIVEAQRQGAFVIELSGAWAATSAPADLTLRVPASDVTLARPAQVAVLQAIRDLVQIGVHKPAASSTKITKVRKDEEG
jgi:hypothetical protein